MSVSQALVAGRYRLLRSLGAGGMGRVWLARDEMLRRDVAIKEVVPPEGLTEAERDELRRRTLREARAAARLNHPNVVRIYDVVHTEQRPWIVMEYIPARSLHEVVNRDGPVPPERAAQIGIAMLGALRAAHAAGVMHRDVKPGNVLLADDGRVVLTDFGLATFEGGDGAVTRPGLILGSPQYISPERAREGVSGPESDLWSLGATLYAAVEGHAPYARSTTWATLTALATEDPDPMRRAGPLKPVLNALLRKDPRSRAKPDEVERLLHRVLGGTGRSWRLLPRQRPRRRPSPAPAPISSAPISSAPISSAPISSAPGVGSAGPASAAASAALALGPAAPVSGPPLAPADSESVEPDAASAPVSDVPVSGAPVSGAPVSGTPVSGAIGDAGPWSPDAAPWSGESANSPPHGVPMLDPVPVSAPPTPSQGEVDDPVRGLGRASVPVLPAEHGRRRGILVAFAIVAAAALLTVIVMLSDLRAIGTWSGDDANSPSVPAVGGLGTATPEQTPTESPTGETPTPRASVPFGLPAGFVLHADPTGFKIAVPAGWTPWTDRTYPQMVYFREPNGSGLLGIDQTNRPKMDPVADWREKETARVRGGDFRDYQHIHIGQVNYHRVAADWEYLYTTSNGTRLHVVNRGFVNQSATKGYAIYWHMPASKWDNTVWMLQQVVYPSFVPAA